MGNVLLSWSAPPLLFIVRPQTCLLTLGWGEGEKPARGKQLKPNRTKTKPNTASQRRRVVFSHHPKLFHGAACIPPSAGGILTPCLCSPAAQKGIRNDKSQRKERSRVSSSLFIEEKKRRRKKIDYFVCLFVSKWTLFMLSVCLNVLRQHLCIPNISRYISRSVFPSFSLSLPSREGQFGINLSPKARKNNRGG